MTSCSDVIPCYGDEICHNGICVSQNCLVSDVICSNHGECVNDACECYRPYGGQFCESCRNSTYELVNSACRRKCDADSDCNIAEVCSTGHCKCKGDGFDYDHVCLQCLPGYKSAQSPDKLHWVCISQACVGMGNVECNRRGSCAYPATKCTCDQPDNFKGDACGQCADGSFATVDGKCSIPRACLSSDMYECSNHGTCKTTDEVEACECYTGYGGQKCERCAGDYTKLDSGECVPTACVDPNNYPLVECHSHGKCNTSTKKCDCETEVATGDYCQTCKAGYALNYAQICTAVECLTDGLECSGNGLCSEKQCACDYKHTGSKCADCAPKFLLANYYCTYYACVSTAQGENVVCGNHGECTFDHIDSEGKCYCFTGYKGDYCKECDTSYVAINGFCEHTNCVKDGVLCGNNGYCYAGDDGRFQCHCQDEVATGDDCTSCIPPYTKDSTGKCTHQECIAENKLDCAGRGACISFGDTENVCICNDNFYPKTKCQTCIPGYELQGNVCLASSEACRGDPNDLELCSGHGTCTTSYLCHCNKQYKGDYCSECASGLYEKDQYGVCRLKCAADADCGLNQQCNASQLCECKDTIYDYDQDCLMCRTGTSIAILDGKLGCFPTSCVDKHRVCNDAGNCLGIGISPTCMCNNEFYTGQFCEDCAYDAIRLANGICTAQDCINSETNTSCSNHGTCMRGQLAGAYCECTTGYTGDHCETCSQGWIKIGDECRNVSCLGANNLECSGNGQCTEKDGVWSCTCNQYSTGRQCFTCNEEVAHPYLGICYPLNCFNENQSYCSAAGKCTKISANITACICDDYGRDPYTACAVCKNGYTLVDGECVDNQCMGTDNKVCSGAGFCKEISKIQDWYECECNTGYTGASCESCNTAEGYIRVGTQCSRPECAYNDTVCSGNGDCQFYFDHSYKCYCMPTATGTHCETCNDTYLQTKEGKCVPESCYVDGTECNNLGKCIAIQFTHQCMCDDIHLTQGSKCSQCEVGYMWLDGECHDENLGCADSKGLICGGHGICNHGTCICHSRYSGEFCSECQPEATKRDTHCYRGCSTNADCGGTFQTCESGVCKCVGEYLDIDQECNYCVPGRLMVEATGKCEPKECVTMQGELCNDAGVCEYVEDLKLYECSCDDQRVADGVRCEICGSKARETKDGKCSPKECFNDNLKCHNHGSCNIGYNGDYSCVCNVGYTGTYCKDCATGYKKDSVHDECVSEMCARRSGTVCSGNGRCVQKIPGDEHSWECQCYSASGMYCDECLEGTTKIGDRCVPASCVADGLECYDFGQCLVLNDTAKCYCDGNRNSATACQTCADGYNMFAGQCYPLDCYASNGWYCNGTGHCIAVGEHENVHICECNEGYEGATCERCATGREKIGRLCVRPECKTNNTNECNGNGICENLDGTWKCTCSFSTGEFCDTCLGGYTKLNNGKCVSESCAIDGKECNNLGICQIHGFSQVCYCIDPEMDAEKQCGACLHGKELIDGKCQTKPDNKGLPVGAIVGIAIGAVVLVALIAVGVWFFVRKNGQKKQSSPMAPTNDYVGQGEPQTYI